MQKTETKTEIYLYIYWGDEQKPFRNLSNFHFIFSSGQHFRELVFTVRSCKRKKGKTLQKYKRNTRSVNMIAAYKGMKLFSLLGPSM